MRFVALVLACLVVGPYAQAAPPARAWTLDDFNGLSLILKIELTEPTTSSGKLQNQKASPTAKIKSVHLDASVIERDEKITFRPLTAAELAQVIVKEKTLRIRGIADVVVVHRAPNGVSFTVKDLIAAIEKTELETRGSSKWDTGIDVHHRFFEGMHRRKDGSWETEWGS